MDFAAIEAGNGPAILQALPSGERFVEDVAALYNDPRSPRRRVAL